MGTQNAESWDNRELGASDEHIVAVSLDIKIDEVLIQESASRAADGDADNSNTP